MAKVLVAMSGGVDSSVAAYLLQGQGHEVVGAWMRLLTNDLLGDADADCAREGRDARRVAELLGIEFHEVDAREAFERDVVRVWADAYEAGFTPNPCIECNRSVKFGFLWDYACRIGCDAIATGHYATVRRADDGRYVIDQGADPTKDQSYMLYSLPQSTLEHVILPLGELDKATVRAIAAEAALPVAAKSDSEDICFIPDGDFVGFLTRWDDVDVIPGRIVGTDGRQLGTHAGAIRYTVGQRKGLGVNGMGVPYYVVGKDMGTNEVIAGPVGGLYVSGLIAEGWNWVGMPSAGPLQARVRTRYHQVDQAATLTPQADGRVRVDFPEPQRAIAPGQAVVAYDGRTLIAGGTIMSTY